MNRETPANRSPIAPPKAKFVAVDRSVMRGLEHVATAISNTFARRIARALNQYVPNDRGI